LVLALIVGVLAFVIPPIADQIGFMTQQLPELVKKVYSTAPAFVQDWLARYQAAPQDIQTALQRGISSMLQTLITTLQTGVFKTVSIVFTTLSFVLGLLVIPLWMFFLLRDQPELHLGFHRLVPAKYQEDADVLVGLMDRIMSSYLRGRLILGLSMAIMATAGLLLLGVNFALLLGTVMGLFEIVPLIGPILGAAPIVVVTLATSPSRLLWVILLIMALQQIIDYLLVPQVARGTVGLHPALVMLVIVIGSEIAGVWGVILSVPITAVVRDVTRYLLLRLSDKPVSPQDAIARLDVRS
jgi:predicted PurR-regulated permease PerM